MAKKWIETTHEIYSAIYGKHGGEMTVFESYTDTSGYNGDDRIITAWGFKQADYATIKSELRGGQWRYFLACPMRDED